MSIIWSIEKQALFARCLRAYYHLQYNTDAAIQKHIETLEAWSDRMIRAALEKVLVQFQATHQDFTQETLHNTALQCMRDSWMQYLNGTWKSTPENSTNIFELYYGDADNYGSLRKLPQEMTDNAKTHIIDAMDAFWFSHFKQEILQTNTTKWTFPKNTFSIDDVEIDEHPDFIYQDNEGKYCAMTWTLGNEDRATLRIRQACHMLYAMEKCHASSADIRISTVYLNDGGRSRDCIVTDSVVSAVRSQILKSAAAMKSHDTQSPSADDFVPSPADDCQYCKYHQLCMAQN